MAICAECRCAIEWVRDPSGLLFTIDADPDPSGTVTLTGQHVEGPLGLVPQARRLDATIPLFDTGTIRYAAHSDRCPGGRAVHPVRQETIEALGTIRHRVQHDRSRIYQHLLESGPRTDEQLADELDMNPNTERPRRGELVSDGLVRKAGVDLTKSGRKASVWAAVDGNGRVTV